MTTRRPRRGPIVAAAVRAAAKRAKTRSVLPTTSLLPRRARARPSAPEAQVRACPAPAICQARASPNLLPFRPSTCSSVAGTTGYGGPCRSCKPFREKLYMKRFALTTIAKAGCPVKGVRAIQPAATVCSRLAPRPTTNHAEKPLAPMLLSSAARQTVALSSSSMRDSQRHRCQSSPVALAARPVLS